MGNQEFGLPKVFQVLYDLIGQDAHCQFVRFPIGGLSVVDNCTRGHLDQQVSSIEEGTRGINEVDPFPNDGVCCSYESERGAHAEPAQSPTIGIHKVLVFLELKGRHEVLPLRGFYPITHPHLRRPLVYHHVAGPSQSISEVNYDFPIETFVVDPQ